MAGLRSALTVLREDLQAARDRDPSARSFVEIALGYPGLHAVWGHRIAHRMWRRAVAPVARPAVLAGGAGRHRGGDPSRRATGPAAFHRPRHGRGDRRDGGGRRRRSAVPRSHARRQIDAARQTTPDAGRRRHRRGRRENPRTGLHRLRRPDRRERRRDHRCADGPCRRRHSGQDPSTSRVRGRMSSLSTTRRSTSEPHDARPVRPAPGSSRACNFSQLK